MHVRAQDETIHLDPVLYTAATPTEIYNACQIPPTSMARPWLRHQPDPTRDYLNKTRQLHPRRKQ